MQDRHALAQPALLITMNSSAVPGVQVAIMRPSSNRTEQARSQSPASRRTTQLSTSSRIASLSCRSTSVIRRFRPRAFRAGVL
jgi:hypothetical protein